MTGTHSILRVTQWSSFFFLSQDHLRDTQWRSFFFERVAWKASSRLLIISQDSTHSPVTPRENMDPLFGVVLLLWVQERKTKRHLWQPLQMPEKSVPKSWLTSKKNNILGRRRPFSWDLLDFELPWYRLRRPLQLSIIRTSGFVTITVKLQCVSNIV